MAAGDLVGAVLDGRYRIVEPLDEGAMGVVYRGERLKLGRAVAIKFLHKWNADDAGARKRFEVEARAMARLEHPNCAAVIDVGEHDGAPYVVMDLVTGTNLRDVLDAGRFAPERAVDFAVQVLGGLAHAHELGIVHRDIKPANIMLTEKEGIGEVVKILDFGLARLRGGPGNLTVGVAIGTPSYMAPEQAVGGAIDARTDVYAVGVMLFEMLAGRKPFVDDDPLEVLRLHREARPPRLADVAPDVDFGPLEDVVARALAKRPEDRFPSATAMAEALTQAMRARRGAAGDAAPRPPSDAGATVSLAPPGPRAPDTGPPMDVSISPNPSVWRPPGAEDLPRPPSMTITRRPARWRPYAYAGAGALIVVIGVVVAITSGGGRAPAAAPLDAAAAPAPAPAPDPAADTLARARALIADGDRDGAIQLLDAARRTFPDSADVPLELGRLYFARLWWNDGEKALRAALKLRPALRSDPDLIKTVLRGFITTPDTDDGLAAFLVDDIGAAAVPYLEETARSHPSPKIRARAAALLQRLH